MFNFQVFPRIADDGTVNPIAAITVTATAANADFDVTISINEARELWSATGRAIEKWDANADVG